MLRVGHAPDAPWVWTVGPRHAHLERFDLHGYPIVRGELRRRYPKLAWPEDPWTAQAERRPRRR